MRRLDEAGVSRMREI
jgi:transposase